MLSPLRIHCRIRFQPLKSLPITEDNLHICYLCIDAPTTVGMDSGDCPKILTVLTKSTEIKGVQKPNPNLQLFNNATSNEVKKHILLLFPRGIILSTIPCFKQGDSLVV
ncbi:hypothetical protein V8G54_009475 [Vigna mungo]|uniref:Uncharacterized protein n=1 Tax=Vigna mungo TaxID=3915 RepID=A0AAQ3NY49_VIGMU